jgi:hypothetical protein
LQAQRDLADQSETSRYSQLRQFLDTELEKHRQQGEQGRAEILARVDELDRELRTAIEQSGNALAASIGEVEDLVQRKLSGEEQIRPKS